MSNTENKEPTAAEEFSDQVSSQLRSLFSDFVDPSSLDGVIEIRVNKGVPRVVSFEPFDSEDSGLGFGKLWFEEDDLEGDEKTTDYSGGDGPTEQSIESKQVVDNSPGFKWL